MRRWKAHGNEELPRLAFAAVRLVLHAAAAMMIGPVIAVLVAGAAYNLLKSSSSAIGSVITVGGYANPLLWGPGFLIGLFLNRALGHRTAYWVWVLGVAWMAIGVNESLQHYYPLRESYGECSALGNLENAFLRMDSSKCGGSSEILDGIFFTIPALSAIAYSIGAKVGIALLQKKSQRLDN